jgi:hypothetical protein
MVVPFRAAYVALVLLAGSASTLASDLAIVGARILPSPDDRPIERGTVVVRDARIAEVGAGIEVPSGIAHSPARVRISPSRQGQRFSGAWSSSRKVARNFAPVAPSTTR